jgi:predicted outer membrane protein
LPKSEVSVFIRSLEMTRIVGTALIVSLCVCSLAWGQGRGDERKAQRDDNRATGRAAGGNARGGARNSSAQNQQAGTSTLDQQIAAFLYGCTRNEIEISRVAQENATKAEVRSFAAMMVKDHSDDLQKLQKAAGNQLSVHETDSSGARKSAEANSENGKTSGTEKVGAQSNGNSPRDERIRDGERSSTSAPRGGQKPASPENEAPGTGRIEGAVGERGTSVRGTNGVGEASINRENTRAASDWNTIHRQIADQCLASTKADLQKKTGSAFDKCYMDQQVLAHMKTLDELKVLRNHATGELRSDLDHSVQMTTQHLEEAKKIAATLEGTIGKSTERSPKSE